MSYEEAIKFAQENDCGYSECSALSDKCCTETLLATISEVFEGKEVQICEPDFEEDQKPIEGCKCLIF